MSCRIAAVALGGYLLLLARMTLWPAPADEPVRDALERALEGLHRKGLPEQVDYAFTEAAANVVLFVPFGVLMVLLLPVRRRVLAVLVPAATSVLIEAVQLAALPRRFATGWDVVMNTSGAVVGTLLALGVLSALERRRLSGP